MNQREMNNQTINLPRCWVCEGIGRAHRVLSPYGQEPIIRKEYICWVCKGNCYNLNANTFTKYILNREIEKYY